MMRRRMFLGAIATSILITPFLAGAQQGKKYTIGFLGQGSESDPPATGNYLAILLKNLRALGYIEGSNLTVDARYAGGRPEQLAPLAADLVNANPQVIAVPSVGIADVVLKYTKTIPVVALAAGSLQMREEVKSLAKPGGNLTGTPISSAQI